MLITITKWISTFLSRVQSQRIPTKLGKMKHIQAYKEVEISHMKIFLT